VLSERCEVPPSPSPVATPFASQTVGDGPLEDRRVFVSGQLACEREDQVDRTRLVVLLDQDQRHSVWSSAAKSRCESMELGMRKILVLVSKSLLLSWEC